MRNSYIIYTVKMKSVSKSILFGLKMMVKSGLYFFQFPPSGKKVIFVTEFLILGKNLLFCEVGEKIFRPNMVILDTDCLLKVEIMFEFLVSCLYHELCLCKLAN